MYLISYFENLLVSSYSFNTATVQLETELLILLPLFFFFFFFLSFFIDNLIELFVCSPTSHFSIKKLLLNLVFRLFYDNYTS